MDLLSYTFTLAMGLPAAALALPWLNTEQNQDEGCVETHGVKGTQGFKEVSHHAVKEGLGEHPSHAENDS